MNVGWEFIRMPAAPGVWQYPDAVPTAAWKVVSASSEETAGEDGRAANAIDGDPRTIWHTSWSKSKAPYPHEIVIDLGGSVRARGARLLPRQSGSNALPRSVSVYLGSSLGDWGAPVFSGDLARDWGVKELPFSGERSGRYLRLVVTSGYAAEPFLALSEIGLIAPAGAGVRKDWQSQYNVAWVEVGGDRFDLHGAQLQAVKEKELASLSGRAWSRVNLPHSTNDEKLGSNDPWRGVCYYRRTVTPQSSWKGKRVTMTFEAAMQVSDFWVDSERVGGRRGGYLPITLDLTPFVAKGRPFTVLARLNNEDNPLVPPGKPFRDLDFSYFGGLYRDAYITVTNPVCVTDPVVENLPRSGGVFVNCKSLDSLSATLDVRTHIRNHLGRAVTVEVMHKLYDPSGEVASIYVDRLAVGANSAGQSLVEMGTAQPKPWTPDSPRLYTLVTSVILDSKVVDSVSTRVGLRTLRLTRKDGLLLNGKPYRLTGTNRHQEYPWVGNAVSNDAQYRDFYKIKEAGFNCVRLSHYPQDPSVYEACDELGIFVIDCIPGWQFMNSDSRFTEGVKQDIRDMIRRDRNHPCVLAWETSLNETYPPAKVANEWHDVAHSEFVGDSFLTAGDALTGAKWDLPYNQWRDGDKSRPQDALPDKPGYIREYGDYEFGGGDSTSRIFPSQGEQALLGEAWNFIWSHNRNRAQYPWTFGDGTWVMYDYTRGYDPRPEASGMSDIFRLPRFTYEFFRSQKMGPPMVSIANWWTPRPSPAKVVVFSNCDEVALLVNGRVVARQKPDSGPDTPYGDYYKGGHPFDGGNGRHLAHPPFTFFGVPYAVGALEAIGYRRGHIVARDVVKTPGKAVGLRLRVDESGRPLRADGGDLVFVYAEVVDAKGVVVRGFSGSVSLSVSGLGSLVGPSSVRAEAGVASFLVRAGVSAGQIRISASGVGLKDGILGIRSRG